MREIVRQGYEAGRYAEVYRSRATLTVLEQRFLDGFLALLPPQPSVLDFGCGPGVPYDRYLVERGCSLTGVDESEKHLALARTAVPGATYLKGDFSRWAAADRFDGLLSLYTVFHVPREEHQSLLATMARALTPRGALLLTLAGRETNGACDDWLGAPMAWSCWAPDVYTRWLHDMGFHVVRAEFEGTPDDEDYHLWVLLQRSSCQDAQDADERA